MSIEGVFLLIWLGFLMLGLTCAFLVLIWSVRNRQFSDQDRARYLPLESGIPENRSKQEKRNSSQNKDERHDT